MADAVGRRILKLGAGVAVLSVAVAGLAGCSRDHLTEPEYDGSMTPSVIPPEEIALIIAYAQEGASIQTAKIEVIAGRHSLGLETRFILTTQGSPPSTVNMPLWYTVITRHDLRHSFNGEYHYDGAGWGASGGEPWTRIYDNNALHTDYPVNFDCELATTEGWVSASSEHWAKWDMLINPIGENNILDFTVMKGPVPDSDRADCPIGGPSNGGGGVVPGGGSMPVVPAMVLG